MQIKMDRAQVREVQERLSFIKNGGNRVVVLSINEALGKVRTRATSEIQEEYALKPRYITQRLKIIKANKGNLSGRIRTPWRGAMLTRYNHSMPKKKAPWVEVTPGSRDNMPGAFYITFANGTKAIAFRPSGSGKYKPNWASTGLYITRGPSVSQALKKVQPELEEYAGEQVMQNLEEFADKLIRGIVK